MEEVKLRKSSVIALVLLLISHALVEKSEAKFNVLCYVKCMALCAPFKNPFLCAADCGINCLGKPLDASISTKEDDPRQFCHLGCAISVCPKLITKENPATEKVEKCVNSCGATCSKNYLPHQ